jgi:N-acetyl-anhydromuramoyl-L-alanine amidase
LNSTSYGINNYMSLREITKDIQRELGGLVVDGAYGKNTALAVLKAVKKPKKKAARKKKSKYKEVFKPTPNKSTRKIEPEGVVLHHSYGNYKGGVSWILDDVSNVSYHVLIAEDGERTVFAKDNERAWHAGTSNFNGRYSCNDFMLGVAFSGDTEKRELTDAEIASAVEYLLPRFEKWGWPKDLSTITTHREVAPTRKVDVDIRAEEAIMKALKKAL